ncbi:MAG: hypothetical protein H7301_06040 [Cryobacterium sp.]|nr:hypothetical protein [Oligoflexia bacterium]
MKQILLLVSNRPDDAAFAQKIAEICELELVRSVDLNTVAATIKDKDVGAIFVDFVNADGFRSFESSIHDQVGLFSDRLNSNRFHYLSDSDFEERKFLIESSLFGNFIYRKFSDVAKAAKAGIRYAYVVKATLGDRAFGIKNLFHPKSQIQVIQVKRSTQKQQVVEALRAYLIKAKYPTRMANTIANAVDELIMNSIFAAPTDPLGRRTYEQTPRDADIMLEDKASIEVSIAFDGVQVGIATTDQYGSIDKQKVLKHLATLYKDEQYKMKLSVAGAGIGLATTFRNGGSLIFLCEKNSKTEVCVIFERLDNIREFKDQFRYIVNQYYY